MHIVPFFGIFRKISPFFMRKQKEISVNKWLDRLLARGTYSFSNEMLQSELNEYSNIAIKRGLNRLTKKGRIISVHKGYYLVITPQYSLKGILPQQLYLDAFMKYLKRLYYVSLLNAAAIHGVSHIQPKQYFVMTGFPVLRTTQKKGQINNYISIRRIPVELIEKKKTEAGYINVSNAVLTICDLVQYEKRVGGITFVVPVIKELSKILHPNCFSQALLNHIHITALQRLGYLLEVVCHQPELADSLYQSMKMEKLNLYRIPFKPSIETKGFSSDNRWKVIVNTIIDSDK